MVLKIADEDQGLIGGVVEVLPHQELNLPLFYVDDFKGVVIMQLHRVYVLIVAAFRYKGALQIIASIGHFICRAAFIDIIPYPEHKSNRR